MSIQVLISILFMLVALGASATLDLKTSLVTSVTNSRTDEVNFVMDSVSQYYLETGSFPSSLAVLAATPGYQYIRQYLLRTDALAPGGASDSLYAISYAISSKYTVTGDPAFSTYQRVAVFAIKNQSVNEAFFKNKVNNKCPDPAASDPSFDLSRTWCGDDTLAIWATRTDRELSSAPIAQASANQVIISDKFKGRYLAVLADSKLTTHKIAGSTAANAFPVSATAVQLKSKVTVPSGATVGTGISTCRGAFYWKPTELPKASIPLECSDLYNYFGNPVSYRKVSNSSIELTSNSRYLAADGVTPVVITKSLTVP